MTSLAQHETSVPVPLITRTGIGVLVRALGPLKTKCGGGRNKKKLRVLWIESDDDFRSDVAHGEIIISSMQSAVAIETLVQVTALVNRIAFEHAAAADEETKPIKDERKV